MYDIERVNNMGFQAPSCVVFEIREKMFIRRTPKTPWGYYLCKRLFE